MLQGILKQGSLLKYDPYRRTWIRLWVALAQRELHCFLNAQESIADSTLPLRDFVAYQVDDSSYSTQGHFFVITPTESWLFSAETQRDCFEWIAAINAFGPTLERPAQHPIPQSVLIPALQRTTIQTTQPSDLSNSVRSRRSLSISNLMSPRGPHQSFQFQTAVSPSPMYLPLVPSSTMTYGQPLARSANLDLSRTATKDQTPPQNKEPIFPETPRMPELPEKALEAIEGEAKVSAEEERLKKYISELESKYLILKKKAKEQFERAEGLQQEVEGLRAKQKQDSDDNEKKIAQLQADMEAQLAKGQGDTNGGALLGASIATNEDEYDLGDTFNSDAMPDGDQVFGDSKGIRRQSSTSSGRRLSEASSVRSKYTYIFKDVASPKLEECNDHVKDIFKSLKEYETGKCDAIALIAKIKSHSLQTKALFHKLCEENHRYENTQRDLEKKITALSSKIDQLTEKNSNLHQENLTSRHEKKKWDEERRMLQSQLIELQSKLDRPSHESTEQTTPRSARSGRRLRTPSTSAS